MTAIIGEMTEDHRLVWRTMRAALWPEADDHDAEIGEVLAAGEVWAFMAEADGIPVGFAELSIRKAANGRKSQPVPFLEGIWIEPTYRCQGVGARLIAHIEAFLKARGFRELGSDSLIEIQLAHNAHKSPPAERSFAAGGANDDRSSYSEAQLRSVLQVSELVYGQVDLDGGCFFDSAEITRHGKLNDISNCSFLIIWFRHECRGAGNSGSKSQTGV
jgi:aminoglycoside 6'-N-acetyltransferase I